MRKSWRIILGILCILSSIIYTISTIKNYYDLQDKVDSGIAIKTTGTKTDIITTNHIAEKLVTCIAKYEYDVDGTTYTESGLSCSTIGKFSVYYDSRNPDVVISVTSLQLSIDFIYLLFPIGLRMLYVGIKKYNYL